MDLTAPTVGIDPAIAITLRAALGLLLVVAAWHKLRDFGAFRSALAAYDLVPLSRQAPAAMLVVAAELVVGTSLILFGGPASALAAAALLALYSGAIAANLLRGRRDIDCGCAGPARRVPLGGGLVVRNLILIGAALSTCLPFAQRPLLWLDAVTIGAGAAALVLLYQTADAAMANVLQMQNLELRALIDSHSGIDTRHPTPDTRPEGSLP